MRLRSGWLTTQDVRHAFDVEQDRVAGVSLLTLCGHEVITEGGPWTSGLDDRCGDCAQLAVD